MGVCRNAHSPVRKAYQKLSELPVLSEAQWLVVESNSTPDSRKALVNFATALPNMRVVSLEQDPADTSRLERIRRARNVYVQEIRKVQPSKVLVMDFDRLLVGHIRVPPDALLSREDVVLTARQAFCYYDTFALRTLKEEWKWKQKRNRGSFWFKLYNWPIRTVPLQIRLSRLTRGRKEIASAFGGMAIYPGRVFLDHDYSGGKFSIEECEHVSFHKSLRNAGYKIFIEPKLIFGFLNEHCFVISPAAKLFRFFPYLSARSSRTSVRT